MAAFNPGNLVVYRIGDGTGSLLNTGNAVFIDEYTVSGTLVQSIALPTVASGNNYQLIASGTATSEGLLTLSADGHYLMLTGYARDIGGTGSISGTAAAVVPRVVGRIDGNGAIDTSTALTDAADSNNIRGATSTNGIDIWVSGGAGGVRYTQFDGDAATDLSTQISTTLTNVREIEVFGGQLYASTQSGSAVRIGTVGTGTPTASGQTIANLPGLPTTTAPNGFFLADLSSAVAGIDTLYLADETAGLIRKYSLVGGNWTATGTITDAAVRGLTGSVSGGNVSLFGTTGDGDADGGGALTAFSDTAGYNGTVSGSATVIATAGLNQAFRGVAFAPMAVASIAINDASVSEGAGGTTTLTFTVTRSGDTSGAVTFDIATADGSATSGSDYVAKSLTAQTIPAGATTYTFTVTVNGDTTAEPNETVLVNLTNVVGATVSDGQGSGTILNDDAADVTAPTLSFSNPVDNATGVAIAANIVLNFGEAVQAGSGNIILRPASGADVTIAVGSGQVTFNGNQVIINPTADLRPGVAYDVIIASGVITDIANNAFTGIAADALDFTTSFEIPAGSFASTFTISDPGTFTLLAGGTRTQTAGTAVQATVTAGSTTIDIEGTLNDTASGQRAIRANLGGGGQITVGANGVVQSLDGNSIQVQSTNPTVNVTNLGQIVSLSSNTAISTGGPAPAGAAFALNFNAVVGAAGAPSTDFTSGGVITNGSAANTTALIRSDSGDAIRLGAHQTLINWGTIDGNGPINDSSTNNFLNPDPAHQSVAQRYDVSRGIRINAATSTNDTIENHGRIEGAQHGVDVGNVNATNIIVNNLAGATILGRNGSGVGADTVGIAATTVQVENFGTILGEYAPQYDRAGYVTVDGDGDGVDVDGGATIINHANALIAGSGAGGFDSSGRANRSEGISIGGGLITNDGTISGANFGIIVNNDSNLDNSRSGVLATTITNGATGSIVGQSGFAIRLENKTGTAADNDIIDNFGTITGNGSIPDPAAIVLRQNNLADPGVNGTLDGVSYTSAADAGNARFISGDGSAIQMGEGDDVLSNHGSIVGNSGRAINLEGGTDTLNLFTGQSIVGRIDGGAGTDSLHLKGSATGSLSNVINFEALAVDGGTWTIADNRKLR